MELLYLNAVYFLIVDTSLNNILDHVLICIYFKWDLIILNISYYRFSLFSYNLFSHILSRFSVDNFLKTVLPKTFQPSLDVLMQLDQIEDWKNLRSRTRKHVYIEKLVH